MPNKQKKPKKEGFIMKMEVMGNQVLVKDVKDVGTFKSTVDGDGHVKLVEIVDIGRESATNVKSLSEKKDHVMKVGDKAVIDDRVGMKFEFDGERYTILNEKFIQVIIH